ncbi:hypothetical protein C0J52_12739 [Blattella germanica]|nr:hypothetical protein C0J52_12739 [Blattella germanica]
MTVLKLYMLLWVINPPFASYLNFMFLKSTCWLRDLVLDTISLLCMYYRIVDSLQVVEGKYVL